MYIIIIITLMLSGLIAGYIARRKNLASIHKVITLLIWTLLFLLGIEVGNNKTIINGFHTIGLEALLITIGAVTGSTLASWALWIIVFKKNSQKGTER